MSESNKLTLKQELFCKYYVLVPETRSNATQSYIEAYKSKYEVAKTEGSKNLAKPGIMEYCNKLIRENILNPVFVDNELAELIKQNENPQVKL